MFLAFNLEPVEVEPKRFVFVCLWGKKTEAQARRWKRFVFVSLKQLHLTATRLQKN